MAKKSGHPNRRGGNARRSPARSRGRPRTPAGQRPLPQGDSFATPDTSPLRRTIERNSATLLVFLHRLPRWVPLVLMLGLLAAALLLQGMLGAVFLGILAVLLIWLAFLSWPNLRVGDKVIRVPALLIVIGTAAYFAVQT